MKVQDIVLSSHVSLDGKPLDFSFKNITSLQGNKLEIFDNKRVEINGAKGWKKKSDSN